MVAALGADVVLAAAADRHARAHDASHFLLVPRVVVVARDADDVATTLAVGTRHATPVTLRSGGTSLSGQAISDGVMVDVRRHFRGIEVLDGGARVRVQPGVTVRQVNARLAAVGRKLGPDPASEGACTIGGVVANNSSGMSCGTVHNTYSTLESMKLVLPSGTVLDTAAPDADERLRRLEPALHARLVELRDRVRGDEESVATLRRQFAMKNTMGYGLNAFLDHTTPAEILAHLLVGSEGTLGFVTSAVFRTVPRHRHAATGLLVFADLEAATSALPLLVGTGPAALELMDAASLRVVQADVDVPELIRDLAVLDHAALLVEYQEADGAGLDRVRAAAIAAIDTLPLTAPYELSTDPAGRAGLWHIRKGLYAAVAGARPSGTTALLEDVVVPVERLAHTCAELTTLFAHHGYADGVIFGHAKDGNIHFMLTGRFDEPAGRARFAAFTEDMVQLVLAQGGSLKAEHGTGRVMAPFVERQYGPELYAVMRELKDACDPTGVMNPGVIMTADATAHLKHVKTSPPVEAEVDRCVECGYCEPVCPSKDLTLTPRQRIVLRRAIAQAQLDGDHELVAELERDFEYGGLETCAVDGMCQTACPVLINTGDLVKRLRSSGHSAPERAVWSAAARHWDATTVAAARALDVAGAVPAPLVRGPNRLGRAVMGEEVLPLWSTDLPRGGTRRSRTAAQGSRAAAAPPVSEAPPAPPVPSEPAAPAAPAAPAPAALAVPVAPEVPTAPAAPITRAAPTTPAAVVAVFLPSCLSAMFSPAGGGPGSQRSFQELCARAGVELVIPDDVDSLCCGTPWASKGLAAGRRAMREKVLASLRVATRDGELPVVCDASSCTEGLENLVASAGTSRPIRVVDSVDFVVEHVLPALRVPERVPTITVHPTCSSTRLGSTDSLLAVAGAIADEVYVPPDWACCAFAGDRGMLHPELTASATAAQSQQVNEFGAVAHASCNRTCEIGMSRATGREYRGILELLHEAAEPPPTV
ncbi:FAD-binding and (Fe-S)-binding domain-containing protein [Georgenia yuyongxinii]|uniref:FAD-binding and (Fe-S)-binding domain-containing protein n=1 Tax=Georgenia yuyongxinii TaxID=2589797 RepID=UPI001E3CB077|nr:FAD-binding and (Fe-S)-binding domain-containing protein [Georgenia yuyongxinii]